MTLAIVFSALGALVLADTLLWHLRFRGAIRRRLAPPPLPAAYPSVSVVRPVRGRDVGAEENFAAALDTGYPGDVETIFVVDDRADPAMPLLDAAIAAHRESGVPGRASVIVAGPLPAGRTGKLNAMMAGMAVARGELVAFGDSDSRPDRDVLRVLVETLASTPRAGCAFAPVVAPLPAHTAGDVGYALMLNGMYGAAVALASSRTGDMPFIMGQLMLFRRDALAAAGGLACAEGHFVDDMRIGACMAEAGWRNVPSAHPLSIINTGMDMAAFLRLMRRWLFFQRAGLPRSFTWPLWVRGLEFGAALAAGLVALFAASPLAAIVPFLAVATIGWSVASLHREFGGSPVAPRHAWVPLALFLSGPIAHVAAVLFPAVRWRGRDYSLDMKARLQAPAAEPVPPEVVQESRAANG